VTQHRTKFSLHEIAGFIGAELVFPDGCRGSDKTVVGDIAALDCAQSGQLSFLTSVNFEKYLATTEASAVIVGPGYRAFHTSAVLLVHKNPYWAFAVAASRIVQKATPELKISPSASIDSSAVLGPGVVVYPGVYIGPGVVVGDHTEIRANVVIEAGCQIGKNCLIHAGVVIGADGFGFAPGPDGIAKVPQIGTVIVEDDVEIGANSTIDRAAFDATIIKRGAKLDSHVHVGHNCVVGESAMICGMSAMAGSSSLGKGAILAGHSGVPNQVEVGPGVVVAAFSVMTKSNLPPGHYAGVPAVPMADWRRQQVLIKRLPDIEKRLKRLEKSHDEE
jgi:UDP-3-O-[3-hydroxymyristoyl] glucosamine N-acyltransferase